MRAPLPSSSSILSSWLYLASLSDLHGAPVFICPVASPTTRSAIKQSSVSPDLCDTMVPHPFSLARLWAAIDSVTEPIWLTFRSRQLQAVFSTAVWILLGLVTVRSSPTICMSVSLVNLVQPSQSSWSKGSSMDNTGYSLMNPLYMSPSWSELIQSSSFVSGILKVQVVLAVLVKLA